MSCNRGISLLTLVMLPCSGDGDDQLPTSHTCMVRTLLKSAFAAHVSVWLCLCLAYLASLNLYGVFTMARVQFQLHLPRYSSATVLKDRLLTAIQNAGQRTDGNTTGTAGHYALSDDMEMLQPQKLNPTCLFDLQLHDGGHCETLLDFCNRAQVDVREIERCIGVTDMGSLLELEDDAVKQALTDTLPGAKKVPAEAQQARARYQAMTLPQLKRTCADSWLEDGGSISEMVDRLVANDIEVYGWEVPPSDERAPLQKPDVARVMVALAQARCRWPADVANPNSAPTRRPKEPEPTLSSADEASSDGDEELDELDEMLTLLAQHHEDESHLRP